VRRPVPAIDDAVLVGQGDEALAIFTRRRIKGRVCNGCAGSDGQDLLDLLFLVVPKFDAIREILGGQALARVLVR
jgi:hypothetical protein